MRTAHHAQLPMYDWPEVSTETDALWATIRTGLTARKLAAPETLDRTLALTEGWRSPKLLFSQTCGLPYINDFADHIRLLGRPTYSAPGCSPGRYRSALVARADDERDTVDAFRTGIVACNAETSQSGWAALEDMLPAGRRLRHGFASVAITGGHRHSIQAVARGAADLAAIDCVAWALAQRHEPAAQPLKAIAWSADYPSPPFITGGRRSDAEVTMLTAALRDAVATLPAYMRNTLLLTGIEEATPADYAPLRRAAA